MRILFVENQRVFAETVIGAFLAAHRVEVQPTVEGARASATREVFDAILVDYDLDDGKGDELVRWLRARGYPGRIVAVSAYEAGNRALLAAGADAVCAKRDFARVERALLVVDATAREVDRCRGALLGTLIGDALGRPFEGTPARDRARLSRSLARRLAEPRGWGYSDDGEMMLAVAESVAARGGVDEAHLLDTLARRHDPARGYGKGARAAFRVALAGGAPDEAARALWPEGSRGNGAAVRVAPVAVLARGRDELEVAELARRSADPTHCHPEGRDAAAVVAVAVRRAIAGVEVSRLATGLAALASGLLAERVDAICDGADLGAHRTDVLAVDSVPPAIAAVVGSTSFVDAVVRAVELGGDTDSVGAIAGAVAGAAHGASAIPASWRDALERGAVAEVERRLARLIAIDEPSR